MFKRARSREFGVALLVALVALCSLATRAAHAETPTGYMQRVANELLAAQRRGGGTSYASVIRSHADVPGIGLNALGKYKPALSKADRPTYYNGVVNFMSRYAAVYGPKYPVAKAIVIGQSAESGQTVSVDTRVELKEGGVYTVRWKLVRRGSVYKVLDAEIMEVSLFADSMTGALQKWFENYIAEKGNNPKELIKLLNSY